MKRCETVRKRNEKDNGANSSCHHFKWFCVRDGSPKGRDSEAGSVHDSPSRRERPENINFK